MMQRRRFQEDMIRRKEEARRSEKRAKVRLKQVIGAEFEDAKKLQMNEMTRQQNLLKREMLVAKLEKIRAIMRQEEEKEDGTGDLSGKESFGAKIFAAELPRQNEGAYALSKDFGKKFFGYRSEPGSNVNHEMSRKKQKKAAKYQNQMESFRDFNVKAESEVSRLRAHLKLKQQKVFNKQLQHKLEEWMEKQDVLNSNKTPKPKKKKPRKRTERKRLIYTNRNETEHIINQRLLSVTRVCKLPPVDGREQKLRTRRPPSADEVGDEYDDFDISEIIATSCDDEADFNAQIYAPDGRIRKKHRMPDFLTSYDEARIAKYIRCREKLASERFLTIEEIFKD